jgi:hypothetical protein
MTTFDHLIGKQLESGSYTWDAHRTMLYAVGVGAGLADPYEELQFTTENTEGVTQQVIPSFIALMSQSSDWIRELGFKAREWDGMEWGWPEGMVHGDQGITLARPIPVSGTVNLTQTLLGVFDKGSGALAIAETRSTLADTGELLGTSRAGMFVRGQGGFGGPRAPADEKPWPKPDRAPDLTVSIEVPIGQSLIYRLLGDVNPHATDPARAWAPMASPAARCSRACATAMSPASAQWTRASPNPCIRVIGSTLRSGAITAERSF